MAEITEKKKIGFQKRAASFDSTSFNKEDNTIEVVFATETPVLSYDWDLGQYFEILSMDKKHIRTARFDRGSSPVLRDHKPNNENHVGVIETHFYKNGEARAKLRFSRRDSIKEYIQDIIDGIVRNISVGYNVYRFQDMSGENDKIPTYMAIDWEPMEISTVSVPADFNASTRDANETPIEVEIVAKQRGADNQGSKVKKTTTMDENKTEEQLAQERAEAQKKENEKLQKERSEAALAEKTRSKAIKEAVRDFGLPETLADELIDKDVTVDAARAEIQKEFAKKDVNKGATNTITLGKDEKDKFREAAGDALLLRANPGTTLVTPERASLAREFRGMNMLRLAEHVLQKEGVKTAGMSPRDIAEMALAGNRSGGLTTSDFPILLGSTFNRTLRAAYQERERTFTPFCRRTTLPDFREMSRAQLSGLIGDFEEVVEMGEYKEGSFTESKETYKLAKYGKTVHISWESIINDDLSAFNRMPQAFANKAAQKQSDLVYAILLSNPAMADGNNLFDAAEHGNTISPGTIINVANLGIARALVREQKDPNGSVLNLIPKMLLVGSANEMLALQYSSSNYVSAKSSDINVWAGTLKPIIEPRVTGNKWFLLCDPGQIDTIETAFLDGEEEIFTENKWDFSRDAFAMKARMVFAAKAIDHRGMFYNPGN